MFELFVGEIGIPRREFLFDIKFWEARRIIRGYQKRGRLEQQLMRLTAYMSCFAFRENKLHKEPQDWLPLPWERDEEYDDAPISEEDREDLITLMDEYNATMRDGKG